MPLGLRIVSRAVNWEPIEGAAAPYTAGLVSQPLALSMLSRWRKVLATHVAPAANSKPRNFPTSRSFGQRGLGLDMEYPTVVVVAHQGEENKRKTCLIGGNCCSGDAVVCSVTERLVV